MSSLLALEFVGSLQALERTAEICETPVEPSRQQLRRGLTGASGGHHTAGLLVHAQADAANPGPQILKVSDLHLNARSPRLGVTLKHVQDHRLPVAHG